jgi:hypothetical protein
MITRPPSFLDRAHSHRNNHGIRLEVRNALCRTRACPARVSDWLPSLSFLVRSFQANLKGIDLASACGSKPAPLFLFDKDLG